MDIQRKREQGPGRRTPRPCRTTGAVMRRPGLVGALAVSLLLGALILPPAAATAAPDQLVPVIVRGQRGSVDVAERLVLDAGGTVGRRISIIDGFAAEVPISELTGLDGSPAIVSVTPDASVRLLGNVDGIDPNKHPGFLAEGGEEHEAARDVAAGLDGGRHRRRADRLGRRPPAGHRPAGDQRPRPLVRLAGFEPDRHRHLWPRHPHGGSDRRTRCCHPARQGGRGGRSLLRRCRSRRSHRLDQGGGERRRDRRLAGHRRDRLDRAAPQQRRAEHPRPQPLLRDRRHAGLPARSAGVRGRGRVAPRHRGGRRGGQLRVRHPSAQQPGVRPLRDRGRW